MITRFVRLVLMCSRSLQDNWSNAHKKRVRFTIYNAPEENGMNYNYKEKMVAYCSFHLVHGATV
jgi:hypothetical protein